jgi:CubicO group peptidase (beta-lactamase class C family)
MVQAGWEGVRQAFEDNFSTRDELGASVCVTWKGETVVDIWGGIRDPADGSAWESDTVVNVFSSTKGLIALGCSLLCDRGLLDINAKVTHYWPEFGAAGKVSRHAWAAEILCSVNCAGSVCEPSSSGM